MRSTILPTTLAFLSACAAAAAPPPSPAAAQVCPAIDHPATLVSPGVRAFVDPATGKLRPPTAEEKRQLVSTARRRFDRVYEVVQRPDGTRIVELDDAFDMSVVATRAPDGKIQQRCAAGLPATAAEEK